MHGIYYVTLTTKKCLTTVMLIVNQLQASLVFLLLQELAILLGMDMMLYLQHQSHLVPTASQALTSYRVLSFSLSRTLCW